MNYKAFEILLSQFYHGRFQESLKIVICVYTCVTLKKYNHRLQGNASSNNLCCTKAGKADLFDFR